MESTGAISGEEFIEDDEDLLHRGKHFEALQPYCTELLELFQNPKHQCAALPALLDFLLNSSSDNLQPFFDYVSFPLLLLLDAAIACRSPQKPDLEDRPTNYYVPHSPYKVSDFVAEGVLRCLEELLKKCRLSMLEQMVMILKKLTNGALLSPSEASEEFREGIIKCFRALLSNVSTCTENSCSCKQITGLPALLDGYLVQPHFSRTSASPLQTGSCLLTFLHSQSASAAVGHWLSLLLKMADAEAGRGHRGSARIRIEAFFTLRVLVAKVGTANALAFFLPGVVSQFTKVLHTSKTILSGAGGNIEAVDHAIRGLAEYLMIVLQDDANLSITETRLSYITGMNSQANEPTHKILEELRQLPIKNSGPKAIADDECHKDKIRDKSEVESHNLVVDVNKGLGSLHVNRTKEWIDETSANVHKLLNATFPHICVHRSKRLRKALLAAVRGLLSECSHTLKDSRLMLLECLLVLVVDDSEDVSTAAQELLEYLFVINKEDHVKSDITEILTRLTEKLQKVVLGSEEALALSHAQKLLVVLYFSGPQFLVDQLLYSPIAAARFLDVLAICLSQNSAFTGSLNKLILAKSSTTGYIHTVAELKAQLCSSMDCQVVFSNEQHGVSKPCSTQEKEISSHLVRAHKSYELPCMPPWFVNGWSPKLYQTFAQILRLVGLSLVAGSGSERNLSVIADIPLSYLRKLVSEIRMRDYNKESWQFWYNKSGSGQLIRQASTAACILNEMIFGLSDQGIETLKRMFHNPAAVINQPTWDIPQEKGGRSQLIDCIGRILHEYLAAEVWNIPLAFDGEAVHLPFHFFNDIAMLQQVIIEAIGIFSICLGEEFSSCGFLHSSLYLLLENLVSSNFNVRNTAGAVLNIVSHTCGYSGVGQLVLASADYIIDSICRQLSHLDLHPQVPNVLAAMLSYIGVAEKILPLLEEPMRSVSLELEILGRHEHPDLTIAFLKAVAEIAKSLKREASQLPTEAESLFKHVEQQIADMEVQRSGRESDKASEAEAKADEWERIVLKLNNSKRYRRTVGSICTSCLTAAIPLLASSKQGACLVALDIIEDGVAALADVETAYKYERGAKEAIEEAIIHSLLQDSMDAAAGEEQGTNEENRLLPAMNKIWPFMVACVRSNDPVVVQRCLSAVTFTIQTCGGDFFSRRFHNDGLHFWRLLLVTITSSYRNPKNSIIKEEKRRSPSSLLRLPYRSSSSSSEVDSSSSSEISSQKVQVAVLNMIANLSGNTKSASSLIAVLKKVSGLVVGIACSGVMGLRDASVNALVGLASMDPDLVWLLLADVYFSLKKKEEEDAESPPHLEEFPGLYRVLPPPSASSEYLYVQYGGQSCGFDITLASVEFVFKKLHTLVFTNQMYIF